MKKEVIFSLAVDEKSNELEALFHIKFKNQKKLLYLQIIGKQTTIESKKSVTKKIKESTPSSLKIYFETDNRFYNLCKLNISDKDNFADKTFSVNINNPSQDFIFHKQNNFPIFNSLFFILCNCSLSIKLEIENLQSEDIIELAGFQKKFISNHNMKSFENKIEGSSSLVDTNLCESEDFNFKNYEQFYTFLVKHLKECFEGRNTLSITNLKVVFIFFKNLKLQLDFFRYFFLCVKLVSLMFFVDVEGFYIREIYV